MIDILEDFTIPTLKCETKTKSCILYQNDKEWEL